MENFTFEHKGFGIRPFREEDAMNPRFWDNVTILETNGNYYPFKNEGNVSDEDVLARKYFNPVGDEIDVEDVEDGRRWTYCLTVTRDSFNRLCGSLQGWNAGRKRKGEAPQTWKQAAETCIEQEQELIRYYLNGEVWGWEVIGPDGELVDSLGSTYYGTDEKKAVTESEFPDQKSFSDWVENWQRENPLRWVESLLSYLDTNADKYDEEPTNWVLEGSNGPAGIRPLMDCEIEAELNGQPGKIVALDDGFLWREGERLPVLISPKNFKPEHLHQIGEQIQTLLEL